MNDLDVLKAGDARAKAAAQKKCRLRKQASDALDAMAKCYQSDGMDSRSAWAAVAKHPAAQVLYAIAN